MTDSIDKSLVYDPLKVLTEHSIIYHCDSEPNDILKVSVMSSDLTKEEDDRIVLEVELEDSSESQIILTTSAATDLALRILSTLIDRELKDG